MPRRQTKSLQTAPPALSKTERAAAFTSLQNQPPRSLEEIKLNLLLDDLDSSYPIIGKKLREASPRQKPDRSVAARILLEVVLDEPDQVTRRAAAQALQQVGPPGRWPDEERLLRAIYDADDQIRLAIVHCLVHYKASDKMRVFKALQQMIHDPNPEVNATAMLALRPLGIDIASAAVPDLIQLIEGRADVQQEAVKTLVWLGVEATEAIPALVTLMQDNSRNLVGVEAGQAVLAIDPGGKTLISLMRTVTDESAREALRLVLRKIGPDARALRLQLQEYWPSGHSGIAQAQPGQPTIHHPDGPEEPDRFWWHDALHHIEPIPCKLLAVIWGKEKVSIEEVEESVWKEDGLLGSELKSALHELNNVLAKAAVSFRYRQKQGYILKT